MTWLWVSLGVVVGVAGLLVLLEPLFPAGPMRPEAYPGELLWGRVSGRYAGEIRADSPDGKTATFRVWDRRALIHERTRTRSPSLHHDQLNWTDEWGYIVSRLQVPPRRESDFYV